MRLMETKGSAITRRSAGLPAILISILMADQSGQLLDQAFNQLRALALQPAASHEITEADLPQVHAMNTMKAIFTTTKLTTQTESLLLSGLSTASQCLASAM